MQFSLRQLAVELALNYQMDLLLDQIGPSECLMRKALNALFQSRAIGPMFETFVQLCVQAAFNGVSKDIKHIWNASIVVCMDSAERF